MALRIWQLLCKLIQRQTYSCLSTNYGLWFAFAGICIITVSIFHFGEVALQWSMIRYAGSFKIIQRYDNIAGKSFEYRMCLPQPIDIVYTWVNGSDPKLIAQLNAVKTKLQKELNVTGKLYSRNKNRNKLINTDKYKWKDSSVCPVPNCVHSYKSAVSGLPRSITLTQLKTISANFSTATKVEFWDEDIDIAFVSFSSREKITNIMHSTLKYKKQKLNTSEVFYTSTIKSGHKRLKTALMMYDVAINVTKTDVKIMVERTLPNSVLTVVLYPDDKRGIIVFKEEKFAVTFKAMFQKNITIKSNHIRVFPVTYVWKPISSSLDTIDEDLSSNRFADNSELRYSLRSVEKFAPWVRKIFVVTNGQIPSWLNLDHPRISIVTHKEIFVNKSHLPTFSSPAIESHIHRIPGLSNKFIYMNDDVFFGTEVWPDDFYTHSKGHKIFLSWAVPNCNEGCPSSWLNDKYCDKACNVSVCDWDGGDCFGDKGKSSWNINSMRNSGLYQHNLGEYCSSGCAHNWIGDRYCDGNCNVPSCGFDAADCGVANFEKIYSESFTKDIFLRKNYVIMIPPGILAMYINFTNILDTIKDGNYNDAPVLRSAVFSKKYKLLSLTFYKNFSDTSIKFQVLGYKGANETEKTVIFFNITINTLSLPLPPTNLTKLSTPIITYPLKLYNESKFQVAKKEFELVPEYPKDLLNMSLPVYLKEKLKSLEDEYLNGELTEFGYNKSMSLIYQEYISATQLQLPVRKLLWYEDNKRLEKQLRDPYTTFFSFLPWEKSAFMKEVAKIYQQNTLMESYKTSLVHKRRLFDSFSSSLLHVSRIYNKAFGYQSRKVPAHMPHMVDRDVINEMQEQFWPYFDATSAHKIRHPQDMQFAFSFNYYLIGVKEVANLSRIFDQVDTDSSGTLSDRELRSLAALLYDLPLTLKSIKDIEQKFKNCSKRLNTKLSNNERQEVYYNPSLPLITEKLFLNCHELWRAKNFTTSKTTKFKHELVGEDDVTFKMIRNNVSYVLYQLDWIRKNRKKFICLNDDLDHAREDTKTVRTILKDFYESLYPIPSQFELSSSYRNKFLYIEDLERWRQRKKNHSNLMNILVILCIVFLTLVLYRRKVGYCIKKCGARLFMTRRYGEHIESI